jgi:hypothetical protein
MGIAEPKFEAVNSLEAALLQAQAGALPTDDFLKVLAESQVFMLIDRDIGPTGIWDNSAEPMILSNAAGAPVLALFTAPERSTQWPSRLPKYQFGMLTDFHWLLRGVAPNVGVVVNPGSTVGLEISPSRVAELRARAGHK